MLAWGQLLLRRASPQHLRGGSGSMLLTSAWITEQLSQSICEPVVTAWLTEYPSGWGQTGSKTRLVSRETATLECPGDPAACMQRQRRGCFNGR